MLSGLFQIGTISRFGSNFNLALFGNCGNTLSGNTNTGKAFLQLRKPLKRFCNLFGEVWLRLWTALAVDSTVLERMLEPLLWEQRVQSLAWSSPGRLQEYVATVRRRHKHRKQSTKTKTTRWSSLWCLRWLSTCCVGQKL